MLLLTQREVAEAIRDHFADIKYLVAEVSKSNGQNPVT
jgi:hypothetical protein